MLHPFQVIY